MLNLILNFEFNLQKKSNVLACISRKKIDLQLACIRSMNKIFSPHSHHFGNQNKFKFKFE